MRMRRKPAWLCANEHAEPTGDPVVDCLRRRCPIARAAARTCDGRPPERGGPEERPGGESAVEDPVIARRAVGVRAAEEADGRHRRPRAEQQVGCRLPERKGTHRGRCGRIHAAGRSQLGSHARRACLERGDDTDGDREGGDQPEQVAPSDEYAPRHGRLVEERRDHILDAEQATTRAAAKNGSASTSASSTRAHRRGDAVSAAGSAKGGGARAGESSPDAIGKGEGLTRLVKASSSVEREPLLLTAVTSDVDSVTIESLDVSFRVLDPSCFPLGCGGAAGLPYARQPVRLPRCLLSGSASGTIAETVAMGAMLKAKSLRLVGVDIRVGRLQHELGGEGARRGDREQAASDDDDAKRGRQIARERHSGRVYGCAAVPLRQQPPPEVGRAKDSLPALGVTAVRRREPGAAVGLAGDALGAREQRGVAQQRDELFVLGAHMRPLAPIEHVPQRQRRGVVQPRTPEVQGVQRPAPDWHCSGEEGWPDARHIHGLERRDLVYGRKDGPHAPHSRVGAAESRSLVVPTHVHVRGAGHLRCDDDHGPDEAVGSAREGGSVAKLLQWPVHVQHLQIGIATLRAAVQVDEQRPPTRWPRRRRLRSKKGVRVAVAVHHGRCARGDISARRQCHGEDHDVEVHQRHCEHE
eukprot:3727033-Prymnesium_polylepis.2